MVDTVRRKSHESTQVFEITSTWSTDVVSSSLVADVVKSIIDFNILIT